MRAISMGAGARTADVWVITEKPVERVTLLANKDDVKVRRIMGQLPSRAADNLFWLGRYLERAEATLRLVRSLCGRSIETDSIIARHAARRSSACSSLLDRLGRRAEIAEARAPRPLVASTALHAG